MARVHPIAAGTHVTQNFKPGKHDGIDYRAATGTTVRASISGVVKTGTGHARAGTWVEIHADDGTVVGYSHLSSRTVKAGQRVKVGDAIGKSGATGNVTGPHLHFYVKRGGKFIDPSRWLAETTPQAADDSLPLKLGSRGPKVGSLQRGLGIQFPGLADFVKVRPGEPLEDDDVFGEQTDAWVEAFQDLTGLAADGVVGQFTVAELAQHSIAL